MRGPELAPELAPAAEHQELAPELAPAERQELAPLAPELAQELARRARVIMAQEQRQELPEQRQELPEQAPAPEVGGSRARSDQSDEGARVLAQAGRLRATGLPAPGCPARVYCAEHGCVQACDVARTLRGEHQAEHQELAQEHQELGPQGAKLRYGVLRAALRVALMMLTVLPKTAGYLGVLLMVLLVLSYYVMRRRVENVIVRKIANRIRNRLAPGPVPTAPEEHHASEDSDGRESGGSGGPR